MIILVSVVSRGGLATTKHGPFLAWCLLLGTRWSLGGNERRQECCLWSAVLLREEIWRGLVSVGVESRGVVTDDNFRVSTVDSDLGSGFRRRDSDHDVAHEP